MRKLLLCALLVAACLLASLLFLAAFVTKGLGLGELGRLPVLHQWYRQHESDPQPGIIVLGDSLGRSAFNARHVNESAAIGQPTAWNLASSARSYPEMLLDIGQPALADSTILLFVSPVTSFNPSKLAINPRKANTYALLGLPERFSDNRERYGSALDAQSMVLLDRPRWQQMAYARWRLPEWLKDSLQVSFGANRERHRYLLGEYNTDLSYPRFGRSLDGDGLARAVDARIELLHDPGYCGISEESCQQALRDIVDGLANTGSELVVVMYPLHPAYRDWLAREYPQYGADWLQDVLGPGRRIIDISDFSVDGLFRDDLHISDEASITLTEHLLQLLREDGS
ncbi:hypothetical protein KDL29_05940 [bacterium]|nr:hypothetical protein [bacterium]